MCWKRGRSGRGAREGEKQAAGERVGAAGELRGIADGILENLREEVRGKEGVRELVGVSSVRR